MFYVLVTLTLGVFIAICSWFGNFIVIACHYGVKDEVHIPENYDVSKRPKNHLSPYEVKIRKNSLIIGSIGAVMYLALMLFLTGFDSINIPLDIILATTVINYVGIACVYCAVNNCLIREFEHIVVFRRYCILLILFFMFTTYLYFTAECNYVAAVSSACALGYITIVCVAQCAAYYIEENRAKKIEREEGFC